MQDEIYKNIALRTGGDVYVGVVGPVRSGKSTFVKNFMQTLVIPRIENKFKRQRAIDELPQSGNGKTVTTIEPKFVPSTAANITLADNVNMNVRLVDSVGYMIPGATGDTENGEKRKIMTPWNDAPMDFDDAGELGTKKVIEDHSTIAIVMTSDGTILDIPRENYIEAEEKTVYQLKELGKPFILLINSTSPESQRTSTLVNELKQKYSVGVLAKNAAQMDEEDFSDVFSRLLWEFPVLDVDFKIPKWIMRLGEKHWLKEKILDMAFSFWQKNDKLSKAAAISKSVFEDGISLSNSGIDLAKGTANLSVDIAPSLMFQIISETTGVTIKSENDLFGVISSLAEAKRGYDKISLALLGAKSTGYGMVSPVFEDYMLEEPTQTEHGSHHGVRLAARAQCLHIIASPVSAVINPVIGEKEQCDSFFNDMKATFGTDKDKIWETEIFSRTVKSLMEENMNSRLAMITPQNKAKLQKAVEKITNAKKGSIIILFT